MSIHESKLEARAQKWPLGRRAPVLGDLEALQGVVDHALRIKCATLA